MAKTSLELYQDMDNINTGDRDPVIFQTLIKNLALSMANFAAAMESVSQFHGAPADDTAPEALILASDLYAAVDAINANDRSDYTLNQLLRMSGLLTAKLAMETEAFAAALGPQAFVREFNSGISVASSGGKRILGLAEAGVTPSSGITKVAKKDSGASTTITGVSTIGPKVFNRVINAGVSCAAEVASVHTPLP